MYVIVQNALFAIVQVAILYYLSHIAKNAVEVNDYSVLEHIFS